jgi:general secretion pathway protein D
MYILPITFLLLIISFGNTTQLLATNQKGQLNSESKSTIVINYENEELVDIINQLAAAKGVNVVLPVGDDSIQETVTFQLNYPVSLDQAWEFLYTFLELSGYSMINQGELYTIVRTSPTITTEPLPLFVGTSAEQLPNTQEPIRYIYFLSNVKLSGEENTEITDLLKIVLPDSAQIFTNVDTNSLILVDTAKNIRSTMQLIQSLDTTEFKESYEVLPLHYISAETIAQLFKEILETTQSQRYRLDTRKKSEVNYFSRHLKVIAEPRTNSLILLGRKQAIERARNFIYRYIDLELESGRSILHVYQLQYLDAHEFAKVLTKVVSSQFESATGQATATPQDTVERFFEGVIIRADSSGEEEPPSLSNDAGLGQYTYYGSNKLIIAATQEDWIRIRQLIEQLDTPQPQVIIEVLIADLTLDDTRVIATTLRNPQEMSLFKDVNFQSAQATPVILNNITNPNTGESMPTTLQADLLRTGVLNTNACPGTSVACGFQAGTTLVSFNDRNTGQTFGLLELRKLFDNDKIISNPHVIATNNQKAEILIGQKRLLQDQASSSEGGTTQVTRKWIEANLTLNITPRISSANTVNLNVEIKIDRFQDSTAIAFNDTSDQGNNTIDNRWVYTNANVYDKDVLALGGLTRVDVQKSVNQTPLLGRVPILGYFLKDRSGITRKTNLTVFISPTIVQPRLRGGTSTYTDSYIDKSKAVIKEGYLFESLQDPITRFFFDSNELIDPLGEIERFVSKDEFMQPAELFEDENQLARINLDTETDSLESEKEKCCTPRTKKMKELVANENNPLLSPKKSINHG